MVILTPGFPASETDSTCLPTVQQLALAIKKHKPEMSLIVISFQYPFFKTPYLWHGIKVVPLGGRNRGGLWRIINWAKAYRQLTNIKKSGHTAILSLWLHECALVGSWFGKMNNLPHRCWLQGQDAKAANRYVRLINPKPDDLVAISDFNAAQMSRNHGIKPAHVIENGINPEMFPVMNNGERQIDILGVGSLIPLKRFQLFVEAVNALRTEYPSLHCVIIGEGPERQHLEDLVKKYDLGKHLSLAGRLPHPQVLEQMAKSRILFHPSEYEGNSTVMIEALYSGCQVVSFIVSREAAFQNVYQVNDLPSMIERLRELLKEPAPAQRVLYHHIRDSAERLMALYDGF